MIDICAVEANLCDFHGTMGEKESSGIFKTYSEHIKKQTSLDVEFIRLGYEFCENGLFHTNQPGLVKKIQMFREKGLKIVFVIPPLHQRYLDIYQSFIESLICHKYVNEFVVNDIGTLIMLRTRLGWDGKITCGRLMDKSIRESRMNMFEISEIEKHKNDLFRPSMMNLFQNQLMLEWNMNALEVDTLPDGQLDVSAWQKDYEIHLHYPRILLSKAAYCEFAQNDCQFINGCQGTCMKYGKTIVHDDKRMIYKEGLSIYCNQTKPLSEAVNGKIRLIYTEGR